MVTAIQAVVEAIKRQLDRPVVEGVAARSRPADGPAEEPPKPKRCTEAWCWTLRPCVACPRKEGEAAFSPEPLAVGLTGPCSAIQRKEAEGPRIH